MYDLCYLCIKWYELSNISFFDLLYISMNY